MGSWSDLQFQAYVSSCDLGLWAKQKVVGGSHDIHATVAYMAYLTTTVKIKPIGILALRKVGAYEPLSPAEELLVADSFWERETHYSLRDSS